MAIKYLIGNKTAGVVAKSYNDKITSIASRSNPDTPLLTEKKSIEIPKKNTYPHKIGCKALMSLY